MRRNALTSVLAIVGIATLALASTFVWNKKPNLGLDLQGGASVVLRPDGAVKREAVEQAKRIIARRVDGLGIAEPEVTRQGDTIVVQLPGVKDPQKALDLVGKTAELRFRPVLSILPPDENAPLQVPATQAPTVSVISNTTVSATTVAGDASSTSVVPGASTTLPAAGSGAARLPAQAASTTTGSTTATTAASTATTAPGTTVAGATTVPADTSSVPVVTTIIKNNTTGNDDATQEVILPSKDKKARYVLGPAFVTGDGVSTATAQFNQSTSQWAVGLSMKGGAKGIDAFNAMAAKCFSGSSTECPGSGARHGQIAIVLDSEVQSAPEIQTASFQADQIQISGAFTQAAANDLSLVLRYGALPVKLKAEAVQTVSATLGKDSLRAGIIAGLIGVVLVLLFMILYYRSLALVVVAGIVISAAILWAFISWIGATMTLSGATGIIVSIGVTVDSYVVFFERLKDDIRAGRTLRSSASRGFASAWRTIVAADLVSLLGAGVLYLLTVGSVRGFALFLGISTAIDLLVAYVFTRPAVRLLSQSKFFAGSDALGVHSGEAIVAGGAA
jgi:preprotein translocase subunit SecD